MTDFLRTRLRRGGTAALLACVILGLLSGPVAFSAGGIGGSNPGSGGNSTGSGGSDWRYECGPGGVGLLITPKEDRVDFVAPFVRCKGGGTGNAVNMGGADSWASSKLNKYCNSGFLVYRFYSRVNEAKEISSTFAWTRSRTNIPMDCNPKTALFHAPHPADAPGQAVGALWQDSTVEKDAFGRPVTRTRDKMIASGAVEKRVGDCRDMQAGFGTRPKDPLAQFFDKSHKNYEMFAPIRQSIFDSYQAWRATLGTHGALTVINAANSPAPENVDQLKYGDSFLCGSDVDFMTAEDEAGGPVFYGTCWVPLNWRARKFEHKNNTKLESWEYYVQDRHGGERVSTEYGNKAVEPGQAEFNPWRKLIRDDVPTIGSIGAPYAPGQEGNNHGSKWTTAGVGDAAYSGSWCYGAEAATSQQEKVAGDVPKAARLELVAEMDPSFQSGGALRQGALSVSKGELYCDNSTPCDSLPGDPRTRPVLWKAYFGLDVTPVTRTSTYSECATPTARGCDFYAPATTGHVFHAKGDPAVPGVDGTASYSRNSLDANKSMRFFNATMPSEKVRVRLTGGRDVQGNPYATVRVRRFQYRTYISCPPSINQGPNGEPQKGQCIETPPIEEELPPAEYPVPIHVVKAPGTQTPLPKGGAQGVNGAFEWDVKVLGATDNPNRS